jgi:hypothetical protein
MSFCHSEEVVKGKRAVYHCNLNHLTKKRGKAMKEGSA